MIQSTERTGRGFLHDVSALDVIAQVLRGEHGDTDREKLDVIHDLVRDTGRERLSIRKEK